MFADPTTRSNGTVMRPAFARWLGTTNDVTRTFCAAAETPDLINLAGGLPPADIYPAAQLAALSRQVVAQHPEDTLGYGPVEGLAPLRDALAARFSSPELRLRRENVLVTSGGMQGLDLIGKVLLEEGGLIAAQFPTYLGALDAWRPRSPAYRAMDLELEGFDPMRALAGAQFAYTVPNFSNPTGRLVGLATRQALVAAAQDTGTWLVEDDPYGMLGYDAAPLPRMIALSGQAGRGAGYDGPVVYLGTMSKELAPGLRIGWVIAAPEMIEALTLAKQGTDLCTSGLTQRLVLAALEAGLVDRTQSFALGVYRARRDALCAALAEHLAKWFTWESPAGGMFVWAVARDPAFDTDRLLEAAMQMGVCIAPSSAFDPEGRNRRAMRLNFTLNPPDRLAEGVVRLASAVRDLLREEA
ncbi:MAG TPA: PLP-dependent aminotransferase family protein [Aliidongia sp.]|nr:PLP-dependent aminotransferase family protein [Aliidongia sp.]